MSKKKTKKRKCAKLTKKEDAVWTYAFTYYKNEGKSDKVADELAYQDTIKEFPRLKKYKCFEL